jgi:hypothetical protein
MLSPLPGFLRISRGFAWQHSRKTWGSSRGEGAVWERCHPRKPTHPACRLLSPRGGQGAPFHAANSDHKAPLVNLSGQTWRSPVGRCCQAARSRGNNSTFPENVRWLPLNPSTKNCCHRVAGGNADGATELIRDGSFRRESKRV